MAEIGLSIGFADGMSKLSWSRAGSIRDLTRVDTARPEELYSLDPRDYQAARQ
jgi:hypothetical protein